MALTHRAASGIALLIGMAVWSEPALAALNDANKESVRLLANDASADYDAGRYEQALEKFQHAYDTAKVPKLALWLANTQAKLGHFVAALELCRQAAGLEKNELWVGNTQQQAQAEAQRLLIQLQPRVPRIVIRVDGITAQDAVLTIDGIEFPNSLIGVDRLVDPGTRKIVGRVGPQVVEESVTLSEGERREILLKFNPQPVTPASTEAAPILPVSAPAATTQPAPVSVVTPSEASSGQASRTWGWIGVSVGAVGLALGATAGIALIAKHSSLSDKCPNNACERAYWSEADSFAAWRTVSTVGFVIGAVGTVTGVTLLLANPKRAATPRLGLWIAPASAGVSGSY